jgi:hypothetical protein
MMSKERHEYLQWKVIRLADKGKLVAFSKLFREEKSELPPSFRFPSGRLGTKFALRRIPPASTDDAVFGSNFLSEFSNSDPIPTNAG